MKQIKIERLTDSHDCETCGSCWAEGARVFLDDELLLDLIPMAACFDGDNFPDDVLYAQILEKLGYEVRIT